MGAFVKPMYKFTFAPPEKRFGDFTLFSKGDKYYCIFIENDKSTLPADDGFSVGNSLGLACSKDGIQWTYEGTVIKPEEQWKNRSLWAPCLLENGDSLVLLYSAISKYDKNPLLTQSVGLAHCTNLLDWKDYCNNPVITPPMTSEYYRGSKTQRLCWRDPYLFRLEDTYYCLLACSDIKKPLERSGCVGLLSSNNLIDWQEQEPLFSPSQYWEIETPAIYNYDGKWILLYGNYTNGHKMRYALSDSCFGPFHEPLQNTLAPSWCYCARIINGNCYYWVRNPKLGKVSTVLAPPKLLTLDGTTLSLHKHPAGPTITPIGLLANGFSYRTNTRKIDLLPTQTGLDLVDLPLKDGVNDLRTIAGEFSSSDQVSVATFDGIVEIYVNERFVHSFFS